MTPKYHMFLGAATIFVGVLVVIVHPNPTGTMVAIAGGVLLGKGYGLWEERTKRQSAKPKR